jgi:hypothetical protein
VNNKKEHSVKRPVKQGPEEVVAEANKIGASTHFDFEAKSLTAYGGLLPVATMLEKFGFQQLVGETLTVKRMTRAMPLYHFVLAIVLAFYIGFSRLHHLRSLAREPMLTGILQVLRLPVTVYLLALSGLPAYGQRATTAGRQRRKRQRIWESAPHTTGGGYLGHRHDRAHLVRPPDARAQGLQPQE